MQFILNLNNHCYIFAFCIKQTRNQDLRKPEIILFYDNIGEKPIIRLNFDFDQRLINRVKIMNSCSKTTEIYTHVI